VHWLVGDVQGCARELDDLLALVHFTPGEDELWLLGDLVNRGPDSLATLRLWRDLGGRGVIGNHEVYALRTFAGGWPRKADTLQALFDAPDAAELLAALRALPALAFVTTAGGREIWAVHAGLHPHWRDLRAVAARIESQPHDDAWLDSPEVRCATRVRCCDAQGERIAFDRAPRDCPPPHRPWDDFWAGPELVVHGHWAWRGHYRREHAIGLDGGCVYGGRLYAYCPEEDRIASVASRSAAT
jgi:bis(5'-nucleosyl)-tetraphosphatase (symmetrical)